MRRGPVHDSSRRQAFRVLMWAHAQMQTRLPDSGPHFVAVETGQAVNLTAGLGRAHQVPVDVVADVDATRGPAHPSVREG